MTETVARPASLDARLTGLDEPVVSVVIAVLNEAENITAVIEEALRKLTAGMPRFELIVVDDGSTDSTAEALRHAKLGHPEIRVIHHDRRCGKTAALRTGVAVARGQVIATMDGDGQNDPADIPKMVSRCLEAAEPRPIVAGIRPRREDVWSRRAATRLANRFRQAVLRDSCPDTGCGMKVFPRDAFLKLPAFEGMHRFLPALFQVYGHPVVCEAVAHRARLSGRSKYTNLGRAIAGAVDLLGVIWLRRRTHLPSRSVED